MWIKTQDLPHLLGWPSILKLISTKQAKHPRKPGILLEQGSVKSADMMRCSSTPAYLDSLVFFLKLSYYVPRPFFY